MAAIGAPIAQHVGEAGIVAQRRQKPRPAVLEHRIGLPRVLRREGGAHHRPADIARAIGKHRREGRGRIQRRHPARLARRRPEAGVRHAERIEHTLTHGDVEGLARPDLDQPTDDVEAVAIVQAGPGIADQRRAGETLHPLREGRVGPVDAELRVEAAAVRGLRPGVGDPARMAHQVDDQQRTCRRGQGELQRPARVFRFGLHLHIGELGNVFRHRIVQVERALFVEAERRDHRDRLGHGEDAEDGIHRHRPLALEISEAHGAFGDRAAVAGDAPDRAGEPSLRRAFFQQRADALQPVGGEAVDGRGRRRFGHAAPPGKGGDRRGEEHPANGISHGDTSWGQRLGACSDIDAL